MNSVETGTNVGGPVEEERPEISNKALEDSFIHAIGGSLDDRESLDDTVKIDEEEITSFLDSLRLSSPRDFNNIREIRMRGTADSEKNYIRTVAKGFVEWRENKN